jgi:hypothetical protein
VKERKKVENKTIRKEIKEKTKKEMDINQQCNANKKSPFIFGVVTVIAENIDMVRLR